MNGILTEDDKSDTAKITIKTKATVPISKAPKTAIRITKTIAVSTSMKSCSKIPIKYFTFTNCDLVYGKVALYCIQRLFSSYAIRFTGITPANIQGKTTNIKFKV